MNKQKNQLKKIIKLKKKNTLNLMTMILQKVITN